MSNEITNLPALQLDALKATEIFVPNGMKSIVARLRNEVTKEVFDMTTKKGREACASVAHKVAKSKTFLDEMGKELTEEWRKKTSIVNDERKYLRDELDKLKEEVRRPLTEYENAEQARIDNLTAMIKQIEINGVEAAEKWLVTPIDLMAEKHGMIELQFANTDWQEFSEWAQQATADALTKISLGIQQRKAYDKDQADLKILREKQAAAEAAERDRKIAEEAAAKAKAAAEAEAQEKADKAAADARAEAERKEKELAAERQKVIDAEAREKKAIADAAAAAAKAETEKLAAVERERQRQIDEENAAAEARKKREQDAAHKNEIRQQIINAMRGVAFSQHPDGFFDQVICELVDAIENGQIPHTKINY